MNISKCAWLPVYIVTSVHGDFNIQLHVCNAVFGGSRGHTCHCNGGVLYHIVLPYRFTYGTMNLLANQAMLLDWQ